MFFVPVFTQKNLKCNVSVEAFDTSIQPAYVMSTALLKCVSMYKCVLVSAGEETSLSTTLMASTHVKLYCIVFLCCPTVLLETPIHTGCQ